MSRLKQVILIRRDLKMRRGKEIAQGSHAAMEFLVSRLRDRIRRHQPLHVALTAPEIEWISAGTGKVCLQVQSEDELLDFHRRALEAGLQSFLIRDSGRTEFAGVPTLTACAIGPDTPERIDAITGDLRLY